MLGDKLPGLPLKRPKQKLSVGRKRKLSAAKENMAGAKKRLRALREEAGEKPELEQEDAEMADLEKADSVSEMLEVSGTVDTARGEHGARLVSPGSHLDNVVFRIHLYCPPGPAPPGPGE